MQMERTIVGLGEVLWDVLPEGKRPGGAPANFAYHVSQLGFDGRVASAVGDDPDGDRILEIFQQKGLKTQIERVAFPTGRVEVTLEREGIPRYDIAEGAAWDNIPWSDPLAQLARRTRAVCFGSLAQRNEASRRTIRRFLDEMPGGADTLRIFDVNLRQDFYTEAILRDSLERCDILKINDEELTVVGRLLALPDGDPDARCRTLLERYALKALILTCGAEGSHVFAPGSASHLKTPRVAVADTVGAGDSFTAAFTAALLKGMAPAEAHRFAVEVSAFVCTQHGAMPELPQALRARLEEDAR